MSLVPLPLLSTPRPGGSPPGEVIRISPDPVAGAAADLITKLYGTRTEITGDDPDLRFVRAPVDQPPPQGLDPLGQAEGYELVTGEHGGVTVTAPTPAGLFRGATTYAQLLAGGVPGIHVRDAPAYAWRGLSLDVVRRFFPVEQVKRVVDLLALYKFNVLHLHLSDSQAWRLEIPGMPELTDPAHWPGGAGSRNGEGRQHYTVADYQELVGYAAERFVTIVPELDMPGHTQAVLSAYPELGERPHPMLGHLDPARAMGFVEDVIAATPGRWLHLGGDEAFGMPHELYAAFMTEALARARKAGKRVVAWQEAARSGSLLPQDVVQCWVGRGDEFDAEKMREQVPEEYHPLLGVVAESFARSPQDTPDAVAQGAWILASPSSVLYLDRRYAEESADPAQNGERPGMPAYTLRSCRESFDWMPGTLEEIPEGARLAGVEAAVWCESVKGFDDLAFLLLPRLSAIAEKAWTAGPTTWDDYRDRVGSHPALWRALGWEAYFRSSDMNA
ncbi:family 20 glycosylhydrolase [Nonomuraea soli]|uniref:beta-N-acetylhexosaminidase n=1 Tax=Nonomuraea soli TaxID=1032476 RepID=A0A7W0CNY0_9ACTN|nr:family 20 glycosylhydrolase [Nonomuraea soli]MBA2894542.1 hexosaminidase [Nonomuraea soli]